MPVRYIKPIPPPRKGRKKALFPRRHRTIQSSVPGYATLLPEKTALGKSGRGRGARTPDLRFWRPPLYQLSYTPVRARSSISSFCAAQVRIRDWPRSGSVLEHAALRGRIAADAHQVRKSDALCPAPPLQPQPVQAGRSGQLVARAGIPPTGMSISKAAGSAHIGPARNLPSNMVLCSGTTKGGRSRPYQPVASRLLTR